MKTHPRLPAALTAAVSGATSTTPTTAQVKAPARLAWLLAGLLSPLPILGQTITAYALPSPLELNNVTSYTNSAFGIRFTVESSVYTNGIDVLSLGSFDYDSGIGTLNGLNGPGFVADQSIKIWADDGSVILASAVIPAASGNANGFVYAAITPVHLAPATYIITVYSNTPGNRDGRLVFQDFVFASGLTMAGMRDSQQNGDIFPVGDLGFSNVTFNGPNFTFQATAIPEPSTYAAFAGFAALGLTAWKRRRHRAAMIMG